MDGTPLLQVSVLVVEDHDDTREFLNFILLDAGALVQVATSAQEAARVLRVSAPDIAVVDLDLPDEDGYWLLGAIRAMPPAKVIRTIAVSAHASPHERARALQAGFDAYLSKPFVPEQLIRVIATLVPREWQ